MVNGSVIEKELRSGRADVLEDLIGRSCVGCVLVALADAVYRQDGCLKAAEGIRDFARGYEGQFDYCGACMAELWMIKRSEADALSMPWVTHRLRQLSVHLEVI